jgi:hypothetical protein
MHVDTEGTVARCEIPASSSRGEAVEASDGGQVKMNTRRFLRRTTSESGWMRGAADKNGGDGDMRTARSVETTDEGLRSGETTKTMK